MLDLIRKLLSVTIWAPGVFGLPPDRYANLYRVVLPLLDVGFVFAGAGAIIHGAPAFSDFASSGTQNLSFVWGVWTVAAGSACLLGISFPRLLAVEIVGKAAIVAAAIVYMIVLLWLTGNGSTTRWVAVGMSVGSALVAAWRLGDLRIEWRIHRKKRRPAASERPEQ